MLTTILYITFLHPSLLFSVSTDIKLTGKFHKAFFFKACKPCLRLQGMEELCFSVNWITGLHCFISLSRFPTLVSSTLRCSKCFPTSRGLLDRHLYPTTVNEAVVIYNQIESWIFNLFCLKKCIKSLFFRVRRFTYLCNVIKVYFCCRV